TQWANSPSHLHSGSTAEFTCKVSGGSDYTYIHWYRALAGGAPQRLLYLSYSKPDPVRESGFSGEKLAAYFQSRSICKLFLYKLEKADRGHYYCAAWEYTQCCKPPAALYKKKKKQTQNYTQQPHPGGAGLISHITASRGVAVLVYFSKTNKEPCGTFKD
uniref:Ig-like domain-containing protein n=1 Tax=Pelusios castaneus TaxID=367368 RepID=A0A8C8SV08_9SAUR